MPVTTQLGQPWTRKHDRPGSPFIASATTTLYPNSLEQLIDICQQRAANERLKATGSHWALSEAAVSDSTFIEMHDPLNRFQAMGRTLLEVIPKCLDREFYNQLASDRHPQFTLIHVEAGKRIYQLYAELDQVDDLSSPDTLAGRIRAGSDNFGYEGPWAFETLGGAGGQTIVGALTTGTHGGDFRLPPIADSVVAIHLVADGGRHYWIESVGEPIIPRLTDDAKLRELYDIPRYRGGSSESNFEIIRDNDVFNAVLVSSGRFGIIYSVVLRAVPQYSLHEDRRLSTWQEVKDYIRQTHGHLFKQWDYPTRDARFLQIAVCLTPHANFTKNLVGITKRWNGAMPISTGRSERVGAILEPHNERIQAPLFERAGRSLVYTPNPDRAYESEPPSLLERACSDSRFLAGIMAAVMQEYVGLFEGSDSVPGESLAAVTLPGGSGLDDILAEFGAVIEMLRSLITGHEPRKRLAQYMDEARVALLEPTGNPKLDAARLLAWQAIAYKLFAGAQANRTYEALSYAVMDEHNYLDRSCNVDVDSIEVFFDATDDRLIAFIDALLAFEQEQEFAGKAFLGYASLRFVGPGRALLGNARFPVTCSVEVACLRGVKGSQEVIDYAETLARNPNFGAIIHWGQRCRLTRQDVERLFGDTPTDPTGRLHTWRTALSRLTDNGRLDGFSSTFTRRTGLEVVAPRISAFATSATSATLGDTVTVNWDCGANPPRAELSLKIESPGTPATVVGQLPHKGSHEFVVTNVGTHVVSIHARHLERFDSKLSAIQVS